MTADHNVDVTIDERLAEEIRRLHREYPKLGHHGLLQALRDNGIHVDAEELKHFLSDAGIKAERSWRPWRWRGLPTWMGGPPDSAE